MQIGYARGSTDDQKLELQCDALSDDGCDKIFEEKISGAGARLPAREKLLAYARCGDCIVVYKLDRLSRSLSDLVEIVTHLTERGVGLCSLCESIDTTTAAGRLMFSRRSPSSRPMSCVKGRAPDSKRHAVAARDSAAPRRSASSNSRWRAP